MKRISLVAPVFTQSGYGVHSRQIARWLLDRPDTKFQIVPVPWGITSWLLDRSTEEGLIGRLMDKTVSVNEAAGADITLQLQLPNEWNPNLGRVNVGITAGVETDRCNPEWVAACNRMSAVIVPSEHTAAGLRAAGEVRVPLVVVPEAYSEAVGDPHIEPIELNLPAENNFLIVAQLTGNSPETDRKNIFYTLKWICEEFAGREDVGVVLKTNSGKGTKIDRKTTAGIIAQVLGEVRKSAFPKVHLLHGAMSDSEVAGLYRHPKIKAFVSLTRGEGYGLPILEAAASGLPIIATGWSGHTEFLKHGKYIAVSHKLVKIPQSRVDGKIFIQNSCWAEPDEADFKRRAKKFLESQSTPREWARELRGKVLQEYSQSSINRQLDSALEVILK